MSAANMRLAALKRFATAITVLTILGHTVLGFEQSYAQVAAAILVGYATEFLFEWVDASARRRPLRWKGGKEELLDFILPAHITALAVAMLLYANDRIWPVVFAVTVAIGSKYLLRVATPGGSKHFLNPSNTGICIALLLFPWVGIAPPYQFTENLSGAADWILPGVLVVVDSLLNARYTRKIPLISAWLIGFVVQALVRNWYFDTPLLAGLAPMTGVAFLLFTFYMVTDPGTTPFSKRGQIAFGAGVALCYGFLMINHVVFGLFFALLPVCVARGTHLFYKNRRLQHTARQRSGIEIGQGLLSD
ncbi:MAG: RnfABCDGE type electron transport complex subunit D [Proteobacteria bacterium]|nr:RnfABCDGE type electron transport complex subunit D [Pseudomonadota bacterium]